MKRTPSKYVAAKLRYDAALAELLEAAPDVCPAMLKAEVLGLAQHMLHRQIDDAVMLAALHAEADDITRSFHTGRRLLMARSEARVFVSIWDDPAFLALSPTQQRLYLFLLSQPDLDHTGVLSLRVKRWSSKSAGITQQMVEVDLKALEAARFVIVDTDTEELLIRSFVRRDRVYRQPNTLCSAIKQLGSVSSKRLRSELAVEVASIMKASDVSDTAMELLRSMAALLPDPASTSVSEPFAEPIADPIGEPIPDDIPDGFEEPILEGIAEGIARGYGERGRGGGKGIGAKAKKSVTKKSRKPRPVADDDPDFVAFYGAYPRAEARARARTAWATAIDVAPAADLIAAAKAFAERCALNRTAPKYIPLASNWLNDERWRDEPSRGTEIHQYRNDEEVFKAWNPDS